MSEWEKQSKKQAAIKHLAHYIAYLDGKHYAVDQKYWDKAKSIVEAIDNE